MKSSYYYGMQPKPISLETVKTKALIRQIFNDSKRSAGARSIAAILMNEHGIKLTRYIAGKLMAQMGLKSCQLKTHKYKHADEEHKAHDNILNRNFSPSAPNQVWTGDVTYIRIKGGWCYLAVVLDLYARRIVGFAVSDSPDSVLTAKALQMAYHTKLKPSSVLFHSERFFRSFKTEWMPKGGYENIAEARTAIIDYIWGYYQSVRPHSFNDYLPPAEKERRYFNKNLLSAVLN